LHAIAALSDEPDANRTKREMVKLYLESLPRRSYRILIFAAVLAALDIALPLHAFGNVFYVLDLVGATLRFDVGYLGRALEGNRLGPHGPVGGRPAGGAHGGGRRADLPLRPETRDLQPSSVE
jgi:hypothetical protein